MVTFVLFYVVVVAVGSHVVMLDVDAYGDLDSIAAIARAPSATDVYADADEKKPAFANSELWADGDESLYYSAAGDSADVTSVTAAKPATAASSDASRHPQQQPVPTPAAAPALAVAAATTKQKQTKGSSQSAAAASSSYENVDSKGRPVVALSDKEKLNRAALMADIKSKPATTKSRVKQTRKATNDAASAYENVGIASQPQASAKTVGDVSASAKQAVTKPELPARHAHKATPAESSQQHSQAPHKETSFQARRDQFEQRSEAAPAARKGSATFASLKPALNDSAAPSAVPRKTSPIPPLRLAQADSPAPSPPPPRKNSQTPTAKPAYVVTTLSYD